MLGEGGRESKDHGEGKKEVERGWGHDDGSGMSESRMKRSTMEEVNLFAGLGVVGGGMSSLSTLHRR